MICLQRAAKEVTELLALQTSRGNGSADLHTQNFSIRSMRDCVYHYIFVISVVCLNSFRQKNKQTTEKWSEKNALLLLCAYAAVSIMPPPLNFSIIQKKTYYNERNSKP